MYKLLLIAALTLGLAGPVAAQSSELDKKLEKAIELYKNDKEDKAQEYLEDILKKNSDFGDGWDLLAKFQYSEYEKSKKYDNLNFKITTKSKDGKEIENDTLASALAGMMADMQPSKLAFGKFMTTCRRGVIHSKEAVFCSMYLRMFNNVDTEVDSNIDRKAIKYYNEAETEFGDHNFAKAAALYKRAIEIQPNFYKANMYLGDCFYAMGNYTEAIDAFKEAVTKYPNLLEPSKYLTDAYGKANLYDKAIDESIRSFTIYPDLSMLRKLEDGVYLKNKKMNVEWMPRGVLPNRVKDTAGLVNIDEEKDKAEGPWIAYQAALGKIRPYCNKNGIITQPNSLTASKYMEVYSWEEMLKNSKDPTLDKAREMQKAGYLDCYVLVTCFHQDFYEQYKDFAAKNKDKIIRYYNNFITYK